MNQIEFNLKRNSLDGGILVVAVPQDYALCIRYIHVHGNSLACVPDSIHKGVDCNTD